MSAAINHIRTASLDVAYEESGNPSGNPVFLMHGWPYDPRDYDDVLPALGAAGCRIIVPYLRGFGDTRFLSTGTPRSGQQAALGNDLRELMDALSAQRAVLAGYDWGGRAACIVSAPDVARWLPPPGRRAHSRNDGDRTGSSPRRNPGCRTILRCARRWRRRMPNAVTIISTAIGRMLCGLLQVRHGHARY
jgi:hypothetical protein